jgi:MerR family transcriptional regulator, light-induced transcriptional regulator
MSHERPGTLASEGLVHIGDLARRTGTRVDTLRAWERRYGLLRPQRSPGGFRLYSHRDEMTVRAMLEEMDRGFPASQAAKLALTRIAQPNGHRAAQLHTRSDAFAQARDELEAALTGFHDALAHHIIDRMLAEFSFDTVLEEVMLPCLVQIGEGWRRGEVNVAHEHFVSNLMRERLLALARLGGWGRGPRAILACGPGERHDIALIGFGIILGRGGWRTTFLGADTPVETLAEASESLQPDVVVLSATLEDRLAVAAPALRRLALTQRLAIAGPAARRDVTVAIGALLLDGGPVAAARRLADPAEPSGHDGSQL